MRRIQDYANISGNGNLDQVLQLLLGNSNLVGTLTAVFLDNTVPGENVMRHYNKVTVPAQSPNSTGLSLF